LETTDIRADKDKWLGTKDVLKLSTWNLRGLNNK
jgi:hypothetical protein